MAIVTCPRPADLERLFLGGLPEKDAEALEQHLLECGSCLEKLKSVTAARDTLADNLAAHGSDKAKTAQDSGEPLLADLIRKLETLRPKPLLRGAPMLNFPCPTCQKKLSVKEGLAGKKVKCPGCGQVMAAPVAVAVGGAGIEDLRTMAPTASPSQAPADLPTNPTADLQDTGTGKADTDHEPSLTDFLAPPQAKDELGRLGNYRILKILGHGGMGVVYQAEDIELKRSVALKAMLPALAASASFGKRFLREAQAMAAVEHDHIVRIYQVAKDRGVPFLAMEFLKGEPLDQRLKRDEKMPLAEVLRIGREIADALAAAHATGLIHRDIKPANIWLQEVASGQLSVASGKSSDSSLAAGHLPLTTSGRVKILDFGLARAAQDAGLTQQGAVIGTPAFMAPEQGRGDAVDGRCDLFSLGVVLYLLSTGKHPFRGNDTVSTLMSVAMDEPAPPCQVNAEVPAALSDLVMRLLAKKVDDRPQTARAVVEHLHKIAEQVPPAPKPARQERQAGQAFEPDGAKSQPGKADLPKKPPKQKALKPVVAGTAAPPRRRRTPLLAAAALLLLGLGVGAYLLAPVIFRLQTPQGTLIVEIDEQEADNVKLSVKQGGRQIELLDLKTKKEITLNAGAYELELVGGKDGLTLTTKQFDLKRGDRKIATVTFEPQVAAGGPATKEPPATKGSPPSKDTGPRTEPVKKDEPEKEKVAKKPDPVTPPQVVQGREKATLKGDTQRVTSVAFSGDGKTLASGGFSGLIKLWDVANGQEKATLKGHTLWVSSVAFSPDGKTLASGGGDKTIKLWDAASGQEKATLKGHTGPVNSVAFSGDGKTLASGGYDTTIKLWDVANAEEKATLKGHTAMVMSVALSPDGKTLASGSDGRDDTTIKLWDVASGQVKATLPRKTYGYSYVAFSGDGKTLAAGSSGGDTTLWDVASGKERVSLNISSGRSVAFSGDGKTLASGGGDKTIKLWDVASGAEMATLKGHTGQVSSVALSPDGKTLASGSDDKTIKLWDLAGINNPVKLPPLDPEWIEKTAQLSGQKQLKAFLAKMKERNPDFDGKVLFPGFNKDGELVALGRLDVTTVTDISPVRALPNLRSLHCSGKSLGAYAGRQQYVGRFADLSPLQGLKLTDLFIINTPVVDLTPLKGMPLTRFTCLSTMVFDLAPLKGMPLTFLHCNGPEVADLTPLQGMALTRLSCSNTAVADLTPLKGMPLTELDCMFTEVADLSPLKGMPLQSLRCMRTKVADLSPLKGMPLTQLSCDRTEVADLSPLKGMPLTILSCGHTEVADLSPLKGMPLTMLTCDQTEVKDLSPLKGMPLTMLTCDHTKVKDLSPLKGMSLKALQCDFVPKRDAEILRSITTLEHVNGEPAQAFLDKHAKARP